MQTSNRVQCIFATAIVLTGALSAQEVRAQDPNSAPNPYRMEENWAKLPQGRKMGAPIAVEVDRDGKSLWVFDRCAANDCSKSDVAPIMKFDPTGKMVANFGAGLFNFPHGLGLDQQGNVYASDERAKNGKGADVVKFSPTGDVLMKLGKPGMPGDAPDMLDGPADVAIAPNGDIYVADGHGGTTNDRVAKFASDGKPIKTWGKHGKRQGEFDTLHSIALDSTGRVFIADRVNSRIQIFDADGKFIAEWKQFGRPSSVFIDKNDVIYVADSQSDEKRNPGFKQGIRVGSAKDGSIAAFIPAPSEEIGAPESLTADDAGTIYAGYTNTMILRRFVKN